MPLHSTVQQMIGASVLIVSVALLAGTSSIPAAAQECSDCKIPSGYTTMKQAGEGCTNKRVVCTCTPPGGKPTKSAQEMCLYTVKAGGGGGGLQPPVLTPKPK